MNKVPFPKRGIYPIDKLEFYNNLIEKGLSKEELKVVRNRIYRIDTYFDTYASIERDTLLQCIKELLNDLK